MYSWASLLVVTLCMREIVLCTLRLSLARSLSSFIRHRERLVKHWEVEISDSKWEIIYKFSLQNKKSLAVRRFTNIEMYSYHIVKSIASDFNLSSVPHYIHICSSILTRERFSGTFSGLTLFRLSNYFCGSSVNVFKVGFMMGRVAFLKEDVLALFEWECPLLRSLSSLIMGFSLKTSKEIP
jgi:hypothetical protein